MNEGLAQLQAAGSIKSGSKRAGAAAIHAITGSSAKGASNSVL
jgi:hypothetical protein